MEIVDVDIDAALAAAAATAAMAAVVALVATTVVAAAAAATAVTPWRLQRPWRSSRRPWPWPRVDVHSEKINLAANFLRGARIEVPTSYVTGTYFGQDLG